MFYLPRLGASVTPVFLVDWKNSEFLGSGMGSAKLDTFLDGGIET
jgi:hypothetical protein